MATNDMNIEASSVMRHVTMNVKVRGLNVLRARMWLAVQVFRLAALVAGCGISIDLGEREG